MYQEIKKLADEAIALQNKDRMDAVLREISAICQQLTDAELLRSEPTGFSKTAAMVAGEPLEAGDLVKLDDGVAKKAAKGAKK